MNINRPFTRDSYQPASSRSGSSRPADNSRNEQVQYESVEPFAAEEIPGGIQYDGDYHGHHDHHYDYGDHYIGGCDSCGDVGCHDCCPPCDSCGGYFPGRNPFGPCPVCCNWRWWHDFEAFGGVQGFKGTPDLGRNGNFGLHYGFNFGAPLWDEQGLGFQFGFSGVHSNFSGDQAFLPRIDDRKQYFITTGVGHRNMFRNLGGFGLQWGVVVDWLRDEYYVEMSQSQIRTEFGLIGPQNDEIGFWGAFGTGQDEDLLLNQIVETWEPIDQYNFYYRRNFLGGSQGRLWVGFTGESDGLFGGDMRFVLSPALACSANFNYLIPNEGRNAGGQLEEGWGMSFNISWYPGLTGQRASCSQYRPMFTVADNSVMMIQRASSVVNNNQQVTAQ